MLKKVYIVYAKRTPLAKRGGGLSSVRVDDLMALLIKDFLQTHHFPPSDIDDVIVGCANQAGEDNRNLARMASLLGGLPFSVPGVTLNRLCASSLDAVVDACGRINLGLAECILVGGAESMTRAPLVLSKPSQAFGRDSQMYDTTFGWRFPNPEMKKRFPLYSMGETAEEVAQRFRISREEQDQFSLQSHQKAVKAQKTGAFQEEILPVPLKLKKGEALLTADEGPRAHTNLSQLAQLKPVFRQGGSVTAGNSSTMNDGAALLALASESFLKRHKLEPLLEITGFGVKGVHPNQMGLGPVEAVKVLCEKYNKRREQFDLIELNEAFAAQVLGCLQELQFDPQKVNLNGGAIALGHPLGCTGARILTTLTYLMKKSPSYKEGLATLCVGVGQGVAVSVRRSC